MKASAPRPPLHHIAGVVVDEEHDLSPAMGAWIMQECKCDIDVVVASDFSGVREGERGREREREGKSALEERAEARFKEEKKRERARLKQEGLVDMILYGDLVLCGEAHDPSSDLSYLVYHTLLLFWTFFWNSFGGLGGYACVVGQFCLTLA